jgi:hypothetical protein
LNAAGDCLQDEQVGRILQVLEQRKLLNRTFVLISWRERLVVRFFDGLQLGLTVEEGIDSEGMNLPI